MISLVVFFRFLRSKPTLLFDWYAIITRFPLKNGIGLSFVSFQLSCDFQVNLLRGHSCETSSDLNRRVQIEFGTERDYLLWWGEKTQIPQKRSIKRKLAILKIG